MGRGIRPIRSMGEDGQRAALELGEAMGLISDHTRQYYSEYYDENGKLKESETGKPSFSMISVDLGDGEIGVVTEASDAHYFTSEFDV